MMTGKIDNILIGLTSAQLFVPLILEMGSRTNYKKRNNFTLQDIIIIIIKGLYYLQQNF